MRKFMTGTILTAAVLMTVSCSHLIYNWGPVSSSGDASLSHYEIHSYMYEKYKSPQALCNLLCSYHNLISLNSKTKKAPPPGICADFGYLLLQEENAVLFNEYATKEQKDIFGYYVYDLRPAFREKGIDMLKMEIAFYPESESYIRPLIEKYENGYKHTDLP